MPFIPTRGQQWPDTANSGASRPIYTCSGCGAQSSSPLNHNHKPGR